ncbi:MAG: glucosidase [Steroidobacteraceae bacterium]|nr:glucosidase [Steroidobacteraceae bacterium]
MFRSFSGCHARVPRARSCAVISNAEQARLDEARKNGIPWRKWGPYLSERQWGTVREDYSDSGNAWDYFTHDQARSRAYQWGEDGIAGLSDDTQTLCFALALWNGADPILKKRLFGLTNSEGNHGEDVKEYYFYLDSTPTHSYMKLLYKYPQAAYPYEKLVVTNRGRSRSEMEYELIDTGVFDTDEYFDVFVEFAKVAPEDILIRITAANRGARAAALHVLPTLWFRKTWDGGQAAAKPQLSAAAGQGRTRAILATGSALGEHQLYCDDSAELLFTENETNTQRLYGMPNATPYVKDAFHEFLVGERRDAVNPSLVGTKAAAHYGMHIGPGESGVVRLRLRKGEVPTKEAVFGAAFDKVFEDRVREADEFYRALTPPKATPDEARVIRQALAGMLWSKQLYLLDASRWLQEHHANPLRGEPRIVRNREWYHMVNDHVISMPDKWEYPWYAAWDLAFHCIALTAVDPDFARDQLQLMLRDVYMHPSGQIPAYEWNFSDVNPPVHAWATLFIHRTNQALGRPADLEFLKRSFLKLALNFAWWVNRKDRFGKNVFEGGFLGLDNIGVFDRSAPLPTGGHLEQADGTAWVALFCQNMVELAVELAAEDPSFQDICTKFLEHFIWIACAMNRTGPDGMWDEEDGFYYDVLRLPDGSAQRLKVRSMVGLLSLCATTVVEPWQRELVPEVAEALAQRMQRMPELARAMHATGAGHRGVMDRGIIALVNEERLRRILGRVLDENEFLSPYGLRSLSKYHEAHPFVFRVDSQEFSVRYLAAESDSGMFGGNSNWRGPIWVPVNALIIRALLQYYLYYGDRFRIECPTGSGREMNLFEVSREIAMRLWRIFLRDASDHRPVFGGTSKFQTDPDWRDCLLFYEYFQGDNGAGMGASHQTGWTGVIARLMQFYGAVDPHKYLEGGRKALFRESVGAAVKE